MPGGKPLNVIDKVHVFSLYLFFAWKILQMFETKNGHCYMSLNVTSKLILIIIRKKFFSFILVIISIYLEHKYVFKFLVKF